MDMLYIYNDKRYLITTRGDNFTIAVEFGTSNYQIISNDIIRNLHKIPFIFDEIKNIIVLYKNLSSPVSNDILINIGTNKYIIDVNYNVIVNNWLDVHNYIISYN